MGRDQIYKEVREMRDISTHTPSWGVTAIVRIDAPDYEISTHTPSWGVTEVGGSKARQSVISTHTPSWGVT